MPTIEQGLPKNAEGSLLRGSGTFSYFSNGWPIDNTGAILFGTTPSYRSEGMLLDSTDRIVENKGGVITDRLNGLPRDSAGKLVTVAQASAVAPLNHLNGFLLDANGRVVVST